MWWPLRFSVTWLQIISSLKGGIVKGNEWSTHEYGQGPCITLTTTGIECRLWQRWPWDFTTIASNKTRCLWYCSFLVQIVLEKEISKNLHKGDALAAVWLKMGCPLKVLVSDRFCLLFIHKVCSLIAGARLIYCAPKSYHIMPLLRELHWLSFCYRFEYKILLHTFKVLQNVCKKFFGRNVPNGNSCSISSKPSLIPDSGLRCRFSGNGTDWNEWQFCLPFTETVNWPVCPFKW